MEQYFDEEDAVTQSSFGITETTLELIAKRYMEANPQNGYIARPFFLNEIKRGKDYRYTVNFADIFPDAPNGSYVYAWGKYLSGEDGELKFTLIPKGPVKIWINTAFIYGTDVTAERYEHMPVSITLPVKKGWNHLVLRFTRTKAGFGGEFGTWLGKLSYYFFRGMERPELPCLLIEGFDYTAPLTEPFADPSPECLPSFCLPLRDWTSEEKKMGVFGRIFSEACTADRAVARTEFHIQDAVQCDFSGTQSGNYAFFLEGELVYSCKEAGPYQFECKLQTGRNNFSVVSECPGKGQPWDFSLDVTPRTDIPLHITNPFFSSTALSWAFAGTFRKTSTAALTGSLDCEMLTGIGEEQTLWRLGMPACWVRLYNENPLYGHWNYPLGVTLYGLIETARLFEKKDRQSTGSAISGYVYSHVAQSIRTLDYALFDKEHFGGATAVHHLLTSIDSLDDCGSFGALVLELAKDGGSRTLPQEFGMVADYIGEYILNKQDRLPEGCFYRRQMMHHFHNDTLWADDLYMSVPFLCRYATYKKDSAIFDLAVLQFEGFKKYLFMEDKNLMSHVYDLKRNMNTGIPWGRGNGWAIFSLTELLMALPLEHPRRESLLSFFRRYAAGCLARQNENGMWHQVLDMPTSYPETSCTAMFICAFCRGLRYGWFDGDTSPYRNAAENAWCALENHAIDREGSVYGVCRGSEFAFNPRYYAEHLLPRLNDTHGIGIVLLAGVELLKLRAKL
ncbi:MAG: glycoside hydrolase family 88 protein [Treponema sp.]|jgi:rhamnogalacturonyl hydrolase YesR|nr:glycoside hydrolase family 88 protein [Treponema sp.]